MCQIGERLEVTLDYLILNLQKLKKCLNFISYTLEYLCFLSKAVKLVRNLMRKTRVYSVIFHVLAKWFIYLFSRHVNSEN